jgi:hypothetical protein
MNAVDMQGACDTLTVFDIPLQNTAPAQIVITSPNTSRLYSDDDGFEREEHEHGDD